MKTDEAMALVRNLEASLRFDAIHGDAHEKAVVASQVRQAASAITALVQERDAERLKRQQVEHDRDSILESLAAAERDAGRYRWLRRGDNDDVVLQLELDTNNEPFAWLLRNEDLDTAIDAAMQGGSDE